MNSDELKSKWKHLSGSVKKKWGRLTDDELTRIDGDKTKLAGVVQERYGVTQKEAARQVEAFCSSERT